MKMYDVSGQCPPILNSSMRSKNCPCISPHIYGLGQSRSSPSLTSLR